MKKLKIKQLVNFSIALLCIALFALLLVSAIGVGVSTLRVLISSFLGLAVTLIINVILHELGHLIVGVFSGLKFYSIQILWLFIGNENGKFKVKLKGTKGEFGSTELLPQNKENVLKNYVYSALGGLIATFILILIQVAICLTVKSIEVYSGLGITFPLTVYIFLVNFFPMFENNDGYLVYKYMSDGNDKVVCENYYTATAELISGIEPRDLDSSLLVNYSQSSSYSAGIRYLRYLAYINHDEESALKELREISDISENALLSDEIYEELFFSAILLNDVRYIKTREQSMTAIFEKSERPQTFRIHASYRFFTGEVDWAKSILQGGIEFCKNYPIKGIAKAEEKYMQAMLDNLK
ncbi:MAG: hypothetical protein E7358_06325 [Clostridiales bacterium]|nr:hypothetical protein [Clostridiales bacterium]